MAELYKNSWFAIGLLITGALLSIISVVGFAYNPGLFSSFSLMVFGLIFSIAGYMVYNIKKIADEMKGVSKK